MGGKPRRKPTILEGMKAVNELANSPLGAFLRGFVDGMRDSIPVAMGPPPTEAEAQRLLDSIKISPPRMEPVHLETTLHFRKVHSIAYCGRSGGRYTVIPEQVTCKACIRAMVRHKLTFATLPGPTK